MSLTDVMSHMGVSWWQQIALVIFVIAFALIVAHVLLRSRKDIDRWSRLPIDDDPADGDRVSGNERTHKGTAR